MSGSVNKVILIGNLGKDPEIRRTQDGRPIANLSIATSESWKDKNTGERKEKTEWHRVVIFNESAAKFAEKFLKKGMKVWLEGQIGTRKWQDKDGQDRYSTEITYNFNGSLVSLEKAEGREQSPEEYGTTRTREESQGPQYGDHRSDGDYGSGSGSKPRPSPGQRRREDDDIPF